MTEQTITNTISIHTQKPYCVYTHTYNNTIFYVGKGRSDRPFKMSQRNVVWKNYVSTIPSYDIQIVYWANNNTEALKEEKRLIHKYHPLCNKLLNGHTQRTWQKQVRTMEKHAVRVHTARQPMAQPKTPSFFSKMIGCFSQLFKTQSSNFTATASPVVTDMLKSTFLK